jgi:hypothetical protein
MCLASQSLPPVSEAPKQYQCNAGHNFNAPAPFTVTFTTLAGPMSSPPLCPLCLVQALDKLAGAKEVEAA